MSSLSTNLVSYYKLDNISDSAGPNTLTNNNSVTFVAGKIGNAANFVRASSQYLYCADSTSLSITGDLSISFWMYLSSSPSTGQVYGIFAKTASYTAYYQNSGGTLRLTTQINGGAYNDFNYTFSTSTWYHVALTKGSTTMTFYVNGVLVSSGSTSATQADNTNNFYIGQEGSNNYFDGKIDEFAIYNRAISADEVSQLFNSGRGNAYPLTDTPSLYGGVAYYKLDSNSNDSVGSNNGTDTSISYSNAGKIGNDATLNGSSSLLSLPTGIVNTANSFTISFWLRPHASSGGSNGSAVFEKANGSNGGWNYGAPSINWSGSNTLGSSNRDTSGIIATIDWGTLSLDTWYHIVMVYDKSVGTYGTIYPYKNATVGTSAANSRLFTNFGNPVRIGRSGDSWQTGYFDGQIDEIATWSRALNSTEITKLYNNGNGLTYPFNSSTGNFLSFI